MLRLVADWPEGDHVPWCSAFVHYIAWLCNLPRPRELPLRARSWLTVGTPVEFPVQGYDVVILSRAGATADPTVIDAPGHVGWYSSRTGARLGEKVWLLGGNQGDMVSLQVYSSGRVLGYRRLA